MKQGSMKEWDVEQRQERIKELQKRNLESSEDEYTKANLVLLAVIALSIIVICFITLYHRLVDGQVEDVKEGRTVLVMSKN